jgi:hypothetical protein
MEAADTVIGVIRSVVKSVVTPKWGLSVGYNWVYSPNGGDRVCFIPLYISQYVIIKLYQLFKPYFTLTTKVTTLFIYGLYYTFREPRPPP